MVHGNIIKQGLYGDSKQPVKAGMPVAIKNVDGKGVIVPYNSTNNAFIGVAIEDTIVHDDNVEGFNGYTPSVSYEGQIDCIAGGALTIGDLVAPSENGFIKASSGTVGVVLKGALKQGDYATVLFMNMPSVASSGGASSYNDLTDKPSVNGVELTGAKTTADLKISYNDLTNKPSAASYKDLANKPKINNVELKDGTQNNTLEELGIQPKA